MNYTKTSLSRALSIGLASMLLAPTFLAGNTYAEGASSYFDWGAQACTMKSYNEENGTNVTRIEDVEFDKITTLNCSGWDIDNIRGLSLMTNLENLDISYNTRLYSLDFSQNTKLKTINVKGNNTTSYDFGYNTELESIVSDRSLYLTTSAYAEKTDEYEGSEYAIDLSGLKFLSPSSVHAESFQTKADIPWSVSITDSNGIVHQVRTQRGYADSEIYFDGDEEVETHSPISINNNCETSGDGDYYTCNNSVYYGDEIDTDAYINNTLSQIFNLDRWILTKVELVSRQENSVELATDTDMVKKGKVLANANYTIRYFFSDSSTVEPSDNEHESGDFVVPTTPDTGFFTNATGELKVSNLLLTLAGISVAGFLGINAYLRIRKHHKTNRF